MLGSSGLPFVRSTLLGWLERGRHGRVPRQEASTADVEPAARARAVCLCRTAGRLRRLRCPDGAEGGAPSGGPASHPTGLPGWTRIEMSLEPGRGTG